jgi:hypothetical protein
VIHQETVYVPRSGLLSPPEPAAPGGRGFPLLATILGSCAVGWCVIGGVLLAVDLSSADVILALTAAGATFYVLIARWAYRDWRTARAEKKGLRRSAPCETVCRDPHRRES